MNNFYYTEACALGVVDAPSYLLPLGDLSTCTIIDPALPTVGFLSVNRRLYANMSLGWGVILDYGVVV